MSKIKNHLGEKYDPCYKHCNPSEEIWITVGCKWIREVLELYPRDCKRILDRVGWTDEIKNMCNKLDENFSRLKRRLERSSSNSGRQTTDDDDSKSLFVEFLAHVRLCNYCKNAPFWLRFHSVTGNYYKYI